MEQELKNKRELLFLLIYYSTLFFLLFFALRYLISWLMPVILGFGVAAMLRPQILRLSRRTPLGEQASAAVCLLGFYIVLAGAAILFFALLFGRLYETMLRFPEIWSENAAPLLQALEERLQAFFSAAFPHAGGGMQPLLGAALRAGEALVTNLSAQLVSWIASIATGLPELALTGIFAAAISVLASMQYRTLGTCIRALLPHSMRAKLSGFSRFLRGTVWRMIRAQAVLVLVTFLQLLAGLLLLGFDYAPSTAAIIALLDLLPFVGTGIVLIPWGIAQIASGSTASGIALILLFVVVEAVQAILKPRLISAQTGLHPIAAIAAMYAGLRIAGIVGMFVMPFVVMLLYKILPAPRREGADCSGFGKYL